MAVAAILGTEPLVIPDDVVDLETFRHWVHHTDLPEKLPIHFLNGQVWVDYELEELISHNRVKNALYFTLMTLVKSKKLGIIMPYGFRYTSLAAEASTEPDMTFLSAENLAEAGVEFTAGPKAEATEMLGTPDLVAEIVSRSSTEKDTDWLKEIYFTTGIREYWLIDARDRDNLQFTIFTRGKKAYRPTKLTAGWTASPIFKQKFRFKIVEEFSLTDFVLETR